MRSIEYYKENSPILNQIYEILPELQIQGKQSILCEIPESIGIKADEKVDNVAKQAIDIPEMTTRQP